VRRALILALLFACATAPRDPCARALASAPGSRCLTLAAYRDKMAAGWIGQMVGVAFGAPTEFRYLGRTIPAEELPTFQPSDINQAFYQDDLYVEATFLGTLSARGLSASREEAASDFAKTSYPLWHANHAGRENLRRGVPPGEAGSPAYSAHPDDIDYQIEADFSGLISPGMPRAAVALGEVFGRLMSYGDGLYGGQFMGCLYAEAFFTREPRRLVEAALLCIPGESQYAEAISDVLAWHREEPRDWLKTWARIDAKYRRDPLYTRSSCRGGGGAKEGEGFSIDAKLNGAYVAMGLLYGGGDIEATLAVATRAGQDSDCNAASAAGVLFTTLGASRLPPRYTAALRADLRFLGSEYTFPALLSVSEALAREAVTQAGGRIEIVEGEELFLIPITPPSPGALERSWLAPGGP
jgi:hypothetical protein